MGANFLHDELPFQIDADEMDENCDVFNSRSNSIFLQSINAGLTVFIDRCWKRVIRRDTNKSSRLLQVQSMFGTREDTSDFTVS